MSKLVNAIQTKDALTANGAVTHSTTNSALLDLFSVAGALRKQSDQEIINLWVKAYCEDNKMALQMLLWIRDCRGGAGERRTFRVIYNWLKNNNQQHASLVSAKVPEIGRWDDLWKSGDLSDYEKELIKANLDNKLLCKWLPRNGVVAKELATYVSKSPREFRKHLVSTSDTVEQKMSAREWGAIKYPSVPSKAMSIYSTAFGKHDQKRFVEYLGAVSKGEAKINSGTLFPYDLLIDLAKGKNAKVVEEQWKALPNYGQSEENMLVVADVSGSMGHFSSTTLQPIHISISLAVYISERNHGLFKDCFLTFTAAPELQVLKGSFPDRLRQLSSAKWGMNTDVQAAFELILSKAEKAKLSEEDMPTKIIIVSDMEFDTATTNNKKTNFEAIEKKYRKAGYNLPSLIFWNVNGRAGNSPVKMGDNNVALVSGSSPSILPSILGPKIDPVTVMLNTINKERYQITI